MIKFEIEETGRKRKCDRAHEMAITCKIKGNGGEVTTQIRHFLEIMNEQAHEPLMVALEDFFKSEIDKFIEEDEDDEE